LATPGTAVQVEFGRLSALSKVKPVSDAGHESVRLVPLLEIEMVGPPGGGGELAPGIPSAEAAPSAAASASVIVALRN